MVKNKNIAGRPNRSSTGKKKKAGAQSESDRDLTALDDPPGSDIPPSPPELQITSQALLCPPDQVYLLASVIFQNTHLEKPATHRLVNYGGARGLPLPEAKDEETRRAAYELAFNTLKYQELLEDVMIDSCFYLSQPMPDDRMSLAAVMLFDFQDRKFLPRRHRGREEIIQEVRDVENYLYRFKTKLAAALARFRIKHNLPSIECFLPESVKTKQERSSSLPLYAWVNAFKSSLDEVHGVLTSAGFSQVKSIGQLEGQNFCQDPHSGDTLVLPAQLRAQLLSTTRLLSDHKLIIQDKSCGLGPSAACLLLPEEADFLMVGFFSGLTVSHAASLIAERRQADGVDLPTVYVCVGDRTNAQREELQQAVTAMGCKNVKLIPEDFQSLDGGDKRLQRVRVILLTPECSVSAVSNPVDFLLRENGDANLLQDLSRGSVAQSKLEALAAQQRKDIDHALKFPKVSAVVYSTCSSYPEENEEVVSGALERAGARTEQEGEPKQAKFRLSPCPFSVRHHAEHPGETGPFFTLEPSEESNGCFLAVLSREPEPAVKEDPHEVLLRANAKGILDGIGSNQQLTRKEQRGHNSRVAKTSHARTPQPHGGQSKKQDAKGSGGSSSLLCGHHDFADRRQSPQGKDKALHLQASKNSSPYSSSSSSKLENNTPKKGITPAPDSTGSGSSPTGPPAPPPCTPLTPVVRPRRAHQEVLRPVVLTLPPVHFPDFFPLKHSRAAISPRLTYNRWRSPSQTVPPPRPGGGLSKDAAVKPRHLF